MPLRVDQHRGDEAELADARGDLVDLGLGVGPRVARVGVQLRRIAVDDAAARLAERVNPACDACHLEPGQARRPPDRSVWYTGSRAQSSGAPLTFASVRDEESGDGRRDELIRTVRRMAERYGMSERTIYRLLKRPEAACFGARPGLQHGRRCPGRARRAGKLAHRALRSPQRRGQQAQGRGGTSRRSPAAFRPGYGCNRHGMRQRWPIVWPERGGRLRFRCSLAPCAHPRDRTLNAAPKRTSGARQPLRSARQAAIAGPCGRWGCS